jgi:hypothetical protein
MAFMKYDKQSEAKLRELIIYVSAMCYRDPGFGKTKLNKILFNIDFDAYHKWGKSISGQQYVALQFGPVPKGMKSVLSNMERKKEIAISHKEYHGKPKQCPIPLRDARVTELFSKDEMALVFEHINAYWDRSGTSMSNSSHQFIGWRAARMGEVIPFEVSLVGTREPTLDEIRKGEQLQHFAKECLARNASGQTQDHHRRA